MEHLTIYPKHPTADAYRVGGFYSPYCLVATDKKFSGAELAAEYWESRYDKEVCSSWAGDYKTIKQASERLEVVKRFATLPHFDEVAS